MTSVKQGVQYYYLSSVLANPSIVKPNFNVQLLKSDIARGIKTLSEDSYSRWGRGITRYSLQFAVLLKVILGEENTHGMTAKVTFSRRQNYRLFIETFSGLTFRFDGIGSGYYGEGSRGCYDILRFFGFSHEQAEKAFSAEAFSVYKRKVN